jgi:DeoR/GlpR family transcriptional regulator of sugar metabolism
MMKTAERRVAIFEMLQKEHTLSVQKIADTFSVSPVTVRRDLAGMESQGLITAVYGGASIREGMASESSVDTRIGSRREIKQAIAARGAALVKDGDSIYVDCGTTAMEMMRYLQTKRITIVTNSWRALEACTDFSHCSILLAPGKYSPISGGSLSADTASFLSQYRFDKAFLSAISADIDSGAAVASAEEAEIKHIVMAVARQSILLADHTKFGAAAMAVFAGLSDFDQIITDDGMDASMRSELRRHCLKIIWCDAG